MKRMILGKLQQSVTLGTESSGHWGDLRLRDKEGAA